jgi:hypothetical protein
MPLKLLRLIFRNVTRSRTRLAATLGGCLVGAFIVCFFLTAEGSLGRMLDAVGSDQNLIVKQKDKF